MKYRDAFNRGSDISGVGVDNSSSKEDMEAFDQLGPQTKHVLNYHFPVPWSSSETLKMIRSHGMDPVKHDSMIATQLTKHADMVRQKLTTMEEVLAPLGDQI